MTTDPSSISRRQATQMFAAAAAGMVGLPGVGAVAAASARPRVADWPKLRAQITGELVDAQQPAFAALRESMVFNALKPPRAPAAILRVASITDVQHAVRFARENSLKIAIRGAGHSWCASSIRDDALLLDMSRLSDLRIDAGKNQAFAEPAVRGAQLLAAAAPLNLAFPVGHCATVPLSGYLLNGGLGWNSGAWGPACLSVEAIDLVDSHGELLRADADQNSDYYWAARGAGPGFFAVVVGYHLRLFPMPGSIRSRFVFFPTSQLDAVGKWLGQVAPKLRPQVEVTCILGTAPPGTPEEIAPAGGRAFTILANAFASTPAEADEWLAFLDTCPQEIKRFAPPVQDTPFEALHAIMAQAMPEGRRFDVDLVWCDASPQDLIARTRDLALQAPSPESFVMFVFLPPPPADAPALPDMAFSMLRGAIVGAYGIWGDESQDAEHQKWVRQMAQVLDPVRAGHYVGETDFLAEADRARRCYSPQAFARLQELRAKYDPTGVFHTYLSQA